MVREVLQREIDRIEGRFKRLEALDSGNEKPWTTGHALLDAALPGGALASDACHDVTPAKPADLPQAAGFILALLTRLPRRGSLVWCQTLSNTREHGRLYPPGLMDAGLSPERIIFVTVPKERDFALALEEALRVGALAAVIGEGPAPDFTASRRLALTARASRVPCFILNASGTLGASAAETRWRIAPIAGPPDDHDPQGPGLPAWRVELVRARGGDSARNPTIAKPLDLTFDHATHRFHPLPPLRHGTARPRERADGAVSAG